MRNEEGSKVDKFLVLSSMFLVFVLPVAFMPRCLFKNVKMEYTACIWRVHSPFTIDHSPFTTKN
jgi:hypothetical protein